MNNNNTYNQNKRKIARTNQKAVIIKMVVKKKQKNIKKIIKRDYKKKLETNTDIENYLMNERI